LQKIGIKAYFVCGSYIIEVVGGIPCLVSLDQVLERWLHRIYAQQATIYKPLYKPIIGCSVRETQGQTLRSLLRNCCFDPRHNVRFIETARWQNRAPRIYRRPADPLVVENAPNLSGVNIGTVALIINPKTDAKPI
jgi:hypothetical protein